MREGQQEMLHNYDPLYYEQVEHMQGTLRLGQATWHSCQYLTFMSVPVTVAVTLFPRNGGYQTVEPMGLDTVSAALHCSYTQWGILVDGYNVTSRRARRRTGLK